MLTDYLLEIDELKKTIKKYDKILLKKTYRESHLSRKIEKLEEENKKLKEEVEWYKKQYEHTMWED